MMNRWLGTTALLLAAVFAAIGFADERAPKTRPPEGVRSTVPNAYALKGAKVVLEAGRVEDGLTVVLRGGKVESILREQAPPADAQVIDLTGKFIYPGLIDAYSEAEVAPPPSDRGLPYWNEQVVPERRAVEGFARDAAAFEKFRQQGITVVAVAPGDRIIKGSSCVVSTSTDELINTILRPDWAQHVRLTVSGGFGARSGYPSSPMGAVALARQAMLDADWYDKAWQAYTTHADTEQPEQSSALAALVAARKANQPFVIDGLNELFVLRADQYAREFGLNLIVRGSGREYTRLDAIAQFKRPIIVPLNFPRAPSVGTPESAATADLESLVHWELAPENPGRLAKAGVTIALTAYGLRDTGEFLSKVRQAIKRGLPADEALRAVTTTPAKLLGIDDVAGSIGAGRWANLIVVDKELWDDKAKIEETWVQGKRFRFVGPKPLDLSGTWNLKLDAAEGKPTDLKLELKDMAERASGTVIRPDLAEIKEKPEAATNKDEAKPEASSPAESKPAENAEAPKVEASAAADATASPSDAAAPAAGQPPAPSVEAAKPTEEKKASSKLDRLTVKDRVLSAGLATKSIGVQPVGVAQLSLTVVEQDGSTRILVGTLTWPDGTSVNVRGDLDATKPVTSEPKPEAKPEDSKPAEAAPPASSDEAPVAGGPGRGRGRFGGMGRGVGGPSGSGASAPAAELSAEEKAELAKVVSTVTFPLGAYGRTEAPAQPSWLLIKNATIWTSSDAGILNNADLLVHDGKIAAVGTNLVAPEGTVVVDGTGKHISAGIIDCHSHMATDGGVNEGAQAITAEVRIGDFIDSNDITIYRQLAGGVTSANILHGSANPIGGQNQVIKLRWGALPEEMKLKGAPLGIKFALGENVKRSNSPIGPNAGPQRYPASRMGVEQIIRDQFQAALDYREAWKAWNETGRGLPPRRDLQSEAILEIVEGKRWIHCHSYRQDEILAFLRTLESFNVRVGSLQHILEGYKVAEVLAAHGATASSFSDWWAYKFEVIDAIPYNGALLHNMGVNVSFNSDDDELARHLNHEAAKAVKYGGVPEAEAIKFVTLNPAKQLRIDHMTGSIEVGKDADFVVWSSSPLSTMSRCEETWIDGRKYFDRSVDLVQRQTHRALRQQLVQKILRSGEPMLGTGEREENPAGLWPREDIYCHSHGDLEAVWMLQHQHANQKSATK